MNRVHTFLILSMIILSLLGLLDASYLTYEKFVGITPACGQGFDCGTVLNSQFAQIGPVPTSAFGILFYVSVLCLSSYLFLKENLRLSLNLGSVGEVPVLTGLMLLASSGLAISMLLVGIMAFVLESWCLFCLASASFSTLIFICTLWLFLTQGHND